MVNEFKNIFEKMCAYDCEERYTIESILEDEWLKNGVPTELKAKDYQWSWSNFLKNNH